MKRTFVHVMKLFFNQTLSKMAVKYFGPVVNQIFKSSI